MSAKDEFKNISAGVTFPISNGASVTPNDSDELEYVTRAIWIGGAGNLSVVTANGDTIVLKGVVAGSLIPIRVVKVLASETTASDIVALW